MGYSLYLKEIDTVFETKGHGPRCTAQGKAQPLLPGLRRENVPDTKPSLDPPLSRGMTHQGVDRLRCGGQRHSGLIPLFLREEISLPRTGCGGVQVSFVVIPRLACPGLRSRDRGIQLFGSWCLSGFRVALRFAPLARNDLE